MNAEVVLNGGESVNHPTITFGPLGRIALANQVVDERPHPIVQLEASIASTDEGFGAAGSLNGLDPGDRGGLIRAAREFASCGGLGEGRFDPRPDHSPPPLLLVIDPGPSGRANQCGDKDRRSQS
jgi:hypothetical protein